VATSLDQYSPFDSGPGADVQEDTWRRFMRHLLPTGVIGDEGGEFEVYADSTGMQVKVRTGECWIRAHWGESTTEKTLGIAAAPTATGTSRKDRVILRADFGGNLIELDVLTGVAGTAPAVPALTRNSLMWEIPVAVVTVGTGVLTIAAADVRDDRQRASAHYRYRQSAAQSIPHVTETALTFGTTERGGADVTPNASGNAFTVQRAGTWTITANIKWANRAAAGTNDARFLWVRKVGTTARLAQDVSWPSGSLYGNAQSVTANAYIAAGEQVEVMVFQRSDGTALDTFPEEESINVAFTWTGY
jgi:hypothetical protein